MNTFNKIWIVPEEALVYEHSRGAFVVNSKLKVMLEEDYIALDANRNSMEHGMGDIEQSDIDVISGISAEIVREVLIPEIEKEVNNGETFANLRQIYNSVILATWYKQALKDSLIGQLYVDQNKTEGVDTKDEGVNQRIYDQYVEAFKTGVANIIREEFDPATQEVVSRKYFTGGADIDPAMLVEKRIGKNTIGRTESSDMFANANRRVINAARGMGDAEVVIVEVKDPAMLTSKEIVEMQELVKSDYYTIFGVKKAADVSVIKEKYRKLIMKWHPDANPTDSDKEKERITNISRVLISAWEALRDPEKRRIYDQRFQGIGGAEEGQSFSEGFGMDDLWKDVADFESRDLETILRELNEADSMFSLELLDDIDKIIKTGEFLDISLKSNEEIKAFIAVLKKNADWRTRYRGVEVLGRMSSDRVLTSSSGGINFYREGTRRKMVGMQGDTPQIVATKGLIEILETDENDSVRNNCANILFSIASAEAIRGLVNNIDQPSKSIRDVVKGTLVVLGNNESTVNNDTAEITVSLLNQIKGLDTTGRMKSQLIDEVLGEIKPEYKNIAVNAVLKSNVVKKMLNSLSVQDGPFEPYESAYIYNGTLQRGIVTAESFDSEDSFQESLRITQDLAEVFNMLIIKRVADGEIQSLGLHLYGTDNLSMHTTEEGEIKEWLEALSKSIERQVDSAMLVTDLKQNILNGEVPGLDDVFTEQEFITAVHRKYSGLVDFGVGYVFAIMLEDGQIDEVEPFKYRLNRDEKGGHAVPDQKHGGIDLNSLILEMNVDKEGSGIEFPPIDESVIKDMHINGLVPLIINVTPVTNVLPLIGLRDEEEDYELGKMY